MSTPYPLAWPETMPRAKAREPGRFKASLNAAMENVRKSLRLFASDSGKPIRNIVISSNVTLGSEKPSDPGVSVWFEWDGLPVCIPVDRYQTVAANLQAIHLIIEARRVELRHGTLALVRATFQGFKALPPARRSWRAVFGFEDDQLVDEDMIDGAFRRLAKERHPDKPGGSEAAMMQLNAARADALRDVGK